MVTINSIWDFPMQPGIYKFVNRANGKVYVGESLYMRDRMCKYRDVVKRGCAVAKIERAFNKHGFDNFSYLILETYPKGTSKKVLIDREAFWIKFFRATENNYGYNVLPYGRNMVGFKMSEEAKRKISVANKGRKLSAERKKQISECQRGRKVSNDWCKGRKLSDEHKRKVSEALKGKLKPQIGKKLAQIDPITDEVIKIWPCIADAVRALFTSKASGYSTLTRILKGKRKTSRGFKWRLATPEDLEEFVPES